ncbi:MAG: hypothetical protein IKW05_05715, partial [Muribaculaceae bacterium]|nr:hypothetical protein [Muribaculaceae bacterium]
MKTIYTNQIEEGISNVILQNRCGNRVTIMTKEERTDLEFVYKPNAYRRKDFAARNFSNRDNMTHLFDEFYLYEIKHEFIKEVEYDPFLTKLHVRLPNGGTNVISILNVVDENCFVISAVSPLTIAFRPKSGGTEYSSMSGGVEGREGVVKQFCSERGEDFVTFVSYSNYLKSRYRVLDDGTYVLQLCEDDFIVVGAEENDRHAEKAMKLQQKTFAQLDEENERKISLFTDVSRITLSEKYKEIEDIVNINRRIVYSMVDEGGVSFGAIQRIYFLIWFRDLMMSTSMFAETGSPSLLRKAFPFCYENPSVNKKDDSGNEIREYLQLVGSHWCKSEDDGLFYITYGLFNLYRSTGDDTYLWEENLKYLISAADIAINTLFDEERGLFGSDTLGESTLANSIFYGYDAVNGSIDQYMVMADLNEGETRKPVYSYSLYHNVNMYNVFRMMEVLIKASPDVEDVVAEKYGKIADQLRLDIVANFKTTANSSDEDCHDEYTFHSGLLIMDDGAEVWMNDYRKHDLWEYTPSISVFPLAVSP